MTASTYYTLCSAIRNRRARLIELWLQAYGLGMADNVSFWAEDLARLNDAELELTELSRAQRQILAAVRPKPLGHAVAVEEVA